MAMTRVCDICGKPVKAPFKQHKVLQAENDSQEPKTYKTTKSYDLHEKCYSGFRQWMRDVSETSAQFVDMHDGQPA